MQTKKTNKFFLPIMFLGLFVLSLFMISQSKSTRKPMPITNINVNTASATSVDTRDWLIYRDEELGIEFKHPTTYSVKKDENWCADRSCIVYKIGNVRQTEQVYFHEVFHLRLYKKTYEYRNASGFDPRFPANVPVNLSLSAEGLQQYFSQYEANVSLPEFNMIHSTQFISFIRANNSSLEDSTQRSVTKVYLAPLDINGFSNIELSEIPGELNGAYDNQVEFTDLFDDYVRSRNGVTTVVDTIAHTIIKRRALEN